MAKLLLFHLASLFSFVSAFSHFSDELCSLEPEEGLGGQSCSTNNRQGTRKVASCLSPGRPCRVLLGFTFLWNFFIHLLIQQILLDYLLHAR